MKWILRLAALLLVVLALFSAVVWFWGGRIARQSLERAGTHALGVETRLDSVGVGLVSGRVDLAGLRVANPEGFEREHFLSLASGRLEVSLGTLTSERIEAPLLELEGIELSLERRAGETNYAHILAHLEGVLERDSSAPSEAGKQFQLREVVIRDATAFVDLLPQGGELTALRLELPELRMRDVGADGAPLSEIVAEIVRALMAGVIEAGAGSLPADLLADLTARVAALEGELDQLGKELIEDASEQLDQLGEQLEGTVEGALGGADAVLKDVLGGGD